MSRIEYVEEPFVESVLLSTFAVVEQHYYQWYHKYAYLMPAVHYEYHQHHWQISKSNRDISFLLVIFVKIHEQRCKNPGKHGQDAVV